MFALYRILLEQGVSMLTFGVCQSPCLTARAYPARASERAASALGIASAIDCFQVPHPTQVFQHGLDQLGRCV